MKVTKSDISLELECWVDELSAAQLAAYERVASEHIAIKNALKTALSSNEGKELFNGQLFQAYSFKGKVLQEFKEATLPKKPLKPVEPPAPASHTPRGGRKRASNFVYLESSDEEEDDVPLAKRIALAGGKKLKDTAASTPSSKSPLTARQKAAAAAGSSTQQVAKNEQQTPKTSKGAAANKSTPAGKIDKNASAATETSPAVKPSEITSVGGLIIGTDSKDKDSKENKETKLQGKTFPSLVVLAKPWLKVKDMSATRAKLDSKVKLVLMLTPNKFAEWLIQEGLLKSEQKCANHRNNELKLGVYSDATKFPYTGGYVWISDCCPHRFVSVFHGSIFEGAPHPPSCILKLIYHWSCQTNIQNVVQWVKVDNVYIKGVYTWLRAICTLAVHQKCKKLGGPEKYVEVGVISLGTTSQDGQQRQVKVEVLGVLDYSEKTIRLRAVEPISDVDRNYKKRFQTILEPLQRWVHKDSIISIDLTVDKMTLYSMGYKNIVQAAATDNTAKHTNSAVMDYLRRIVPRMFQNTLSLLSRQMIQQFLDELVWREQFGTYALQAFNNITTHISEQTRMNTTETLTQRLYQVATNPFKDWSVLPANCKETPANNAPKRLKKPINEADYSNPDKSYKIKKEKELSPMPLTPTVGKRRGVAAIDEDYRPDKRSTSAKAAQAAKTATTAVKTAATPKSTAQNKLTLAKATPPTTSAKPAAKNTPNTNKRPIAEIKVKKEIDDDLKGLEELYYGVKDGDEDNFENFPYNAAKCAAGIVATSVDCPICDTTETFDSNEKLQTHIVSHINLEGKDLQFQCLFCLDKKVSESVLSKHNQIMHPAETKITTSPSYHCLICQQRFNSFLHLTNHLQKLHNVLELPYACQACGYRSSSHRDLVRHFYDDHKGQNFLQCPFCLDIFHFTYKGKLNVSQIENYYMHLRQHITKKDVNLRCHKCALSFIDKGSVRQHIFIHHNSLLKVSSTVRRLLNNSMLINPPKVRTHHRDPLPFVIAEKFNDYFAFVDGAICAECNTEIISEKHFPNLMKCVKCNYKSNCERAMFKHTADCAGANCTRDVMELPLPNEMHCICGFSTAIANKMAHHLAVCRQKSAYCTHEMALENTVKRNMLDMLGLMRRDGEQGTEGDDALSMSEQQSTTGDDNQQPTLSELNQSSISDDQPPIQFGEMEATPVVGDQQGADQSQYSHIIDDNDLQQQEGQQQSQYHMNFGQTDVQQTQLNTSDIDMPLIGDLADPNPQPTETFLGEVHTPMFDAVAAAEQQHYQ